MTSSLEANEYDLVVIGSGPAGQKGAICAAKMRKKVAIIDRKKTIGGVCVHTGTIPGKTFREAVLYLSGFRQRTFYGRGYVLKDRIAMSDLIFRAQAVMASEIEVIKTQLRRNYITILEGDARFIDAHTLEIKSDDGSQLVRGQHVLIACGTRPAQTADIPAAEIIHNTPSRTHLGSDDRVLPRRRVQLPYSRRSLQGSCAGWVK